MSWKGLLLLNFHPDLVSNKLKIFPKAPNPSSCFPRRRQKISVMVSNWEDHNQLLTWSCLGSLNPEPTTTPLSNKRQNSCRYGVKKGFSYLILRPWQISVSSTATLNITVGGGRKSLTSSLKGRSDPKHHRLHNHSPICLAITPTAPDDSKLCKTFCVFRIKYAYFPQQLCPNEEEQSRSFSLQWRNPQSCLRIGNYSVHYPSYCSHWWMK